MRLRAKILQLLAAGACIFFYDYFSPTVLNAAPGDTLKPVYSFNRCGLNYTQSSVVLGKKMKVYGMPYEGIEQPATLAISGIPDSAKIEKAFVWFDLTGVDNNEDFILENPSGIKDTFQGQFIKNDASGCWANGASAFRANVTSIISGNGTYYISGFPTDTTFALPDVNGATLFIIYSDPYAMNSGTIIIYEGHTKINFDTLTQSIYGLSITSASTYAEAFMLVTDYENAPGNAIKMNNGSYQGVADKFWNFEKKSTVIVQGQVSSEFGVRVPYDCVNFFLMGIYYRQNTDTTPPAITRASDTLTSSASTIYQWNLNGNPIANATGKSFFADKPGIYSVTTANNIGCLIPSDTFFVKCLTQYKAPIYHYGAQFWTDSVYVSYQWYADSVIAVDATYPAFTAPDTGYYSVKVTDTLGCIYFSNSVFTNLSGVSHIFHSSHLITINPNPVSGRVSITFNETPKEGYAIAIYDITGRKIMSQKIPDLQNPDTLFYVDLSSYESSVYLLEITEFGKTIYYGKILKY